ncbi:72 kDa type IV collagenase-like [Anneissia japonica]|uniref:72 kDa type IV collagenase-like n=1 Tax=Anneissia japonica TaxID=1529436 RepID=UPI001425AC59|nr:72 kDa type IV collagenase-like [Anneissia japonica]
MLKCLILTATLCAIASAADSTIDQDAYNYLHQFGWVGEGPDGSQAEPAAVKEAIKAFQRFAGIKETGKIDKRTERMMEKPRCGVPDVLGSGLMDMPIAELKLNTSNPYGNNRARRYTADGTKWTKNDLTYYYNNYTPDLSGVAQKDALRRAFDLWAGVTPLTFTEVSSLPADIIIEFASGTHSDGPWAAFDGQGGTLAHAYFPQNGDAHFDEDEDWTVGVDRGINLFIVAAHEFGHSLGLGHSSVQGALMYPWYQGYVADYQLPNDDINGIQYLYGMPRVTRPPEPKPDPKTDGPANEKPTKNTLCKDSEFVIDDMIRGPDGKTYMFMGRYYYEIDDVGIKVGPKKISKLFPGVPSNFNAVVTSPWSKRTYFFKGDRYWRFYNFQLESGYPKKTTDTGIPKGPNAAFVWGGNGQMYIVKGNKYYNFNEQEQKVIGAPKKFKAYWKGVPTPIDGAFQWRNGKTYFFKGRKYWRFNDSARKVDKDYPKKTKTAWFGCGSSDAIPSRLQQAGAKQE